MWACRSRPSTRLSFGRDNHERVHGRKVSQMNRAGRLSAVRTLGWGLPVEFRADLTATGLRDRLAATTQSKLESLVETILPPEVRQAELVGFVRPDGAAKLWIPSVERRPWWRLSPMFHGRIEAVEGGSSLLVGELRVRMHVLMGALGLIPLVVFWPVSGAFLQSGVLIPLFCLARFFWDVGYALPRTSAVLFDRIEACVDGRQGRPGT